MNLFIGIGHLTADPEVRYAQTNNGTLAIGSYTIAVNRQKKEETDFIRCKVVGKSAEFAEKYLRKGTKIAIEGRLQIDNYTDKDGNRKSSTYVLVNSHEFCESKSTQQVAKAQSNSTFPGMGDGFINIPNGVYDEGLPFH